MNVSKKASKISRRTFLQVAALSTSAATLAACAPPPVSPAPASSAQPAPSVAASSGSTKVTLWGWWKERMDLFQKSANDFSQANPNVAITVESFDKDYWQKLLAAVSANTGPTLSKMQTTNYFKLRNQDLLVKLDEGTLSPAVLKKLYPNHAWDTYDYFVAPEGNQIALLTYNKDLMSKAGLDADKPPTTWDEFFVAAEKLTQRSGDKVNVAGFQYDDWLPTLNPLYQQGGNLIKRDGDTVTATFSTPEMEKALGFFVELADKRKAFDPTFPYFTDAIGNQQAAMTLSESWGYGTWKTTYPDTFKNLGFAPPPTPTGKAEPLYGRQNSVLSLSALKNRPTDEIQAGMNFISYLINDRKDTQLELANISGLVPAHAELLTDPKVMSDPFLKLAAGIVLKEHDAGELASPLTQLLGDVMTKLLTDKASIAEVMQFGQDGLTKLIADQSIGLLR